MRDETYRIYVTDSLKAIGNLNIRYFEMVHKNERFTTEEEAEEEAEKIIQQMIELSNKL